MTEERRKTRAIKSQRSCVHNEASDSRHLNTNTVLRHSHYQIHEQENPTPKKPKPCPCSSSSSSSSSSSHHHHPYNNSKSLNTCHPSPHQTPRGVQTKIESSSLPTPPSPPGFYQNQILGISLPSLFGTITCRNPPPPSSGLLMTNCLSPVTVL